MNELQKKVLRFLLAEMKGVNLPHDEYSFPKLSEEERRWLSIMLVSHWKEEEIWDGEAFTDFSISSLIGLAEHWLTGE